MTLPYPTTVSALVCQMRVARSDNAEGRIIQRQHRFIGRADRLMPWIKDAEADFKAAENNAVRLGYALNARNWWADVSDFYAAADMKDLMKIADGHHQRWAEQVVALRGAMKGASL